MSGKHAVRHRKTRVAPAPLRRTPIADGLLRLSQLAGMVQMASIASLPVLMAADLLSGKAWAAAQVVPVVQRVAATALPSAMPKTEYGSTIGYSVGGTVAAPIATITQLDPTNIVSWNSFDIGAAARVNIVQPSASSVLLNKVAGGAFLNQTTIDGMLNANGRVYIYNPNGIIFGKTANVNVNTLMASSLKFDETRIKGGLLLPGATPVLAADPAGGVPGAILVDGDGSGRAVLTASNGGLILLAAPSVSNNGVLSAPDGQVVLAAGSKVYLAAPDATTAINLRGLLVEVSNDPEAGNDASARVGTSTAENGLGASMSVGRGNATMIGYAVNQNGIVSASTSVSLNGSIYLRARDQTTADDGGHYIAHRAGTLTLGANSLTQVMPAVDAATAAVTAAFNKSVVDLSGASIILMENARIVAPGGNVTLTAKRLQGDTVPLPVDPRTDVYRVDFAAGSSIDVAGSTGTVLPMESNVITVDLRGTELADNVVLRNSPLYGQKVQIDIRKGMQAANVSGWLDLVESTVGQKNTAGGSVTVNADSAIIQRAGSKINVDGGWVDYADGHVNTSQLRRNDILVDIGAAAPNTLYGGVVNGPDSQANYEAGYRQGGSAGSIAFSAPILVMQGGLSGQASPGAHQRDPGAASFPAGGKLVLATTSAQPADTFKIEFAAAAPSGGSATAAAPAPGAAFDVSLADQRLLASRLELDPAALARAGFNRIEATTTGDIEVAAPVALAAGGYLKLKALESETAGGNLSFKSGVSIAGGTVTATASNLLVADGVAFDLAGRWYNDITSALVDAGGNPGGTLAINGGALNLSVIHSEKHIDVLTIGNDVSIDVSAGAALDIHRRSTLGNAGSVTLKAGALGSDKTATAASMRIGSGLALAAYGFSKGGKLTLENRNVVIGAAAADPATLVLQPGFFQQGGFSSYDISANLNLSVLTNTLLAPRALSWQLAPNSGSAPSGAMGGVAAPVLFDLNGAGRVRPATSLTLQALSELAAGGGKLTVNEGAQVVLDPGANLNLYAAQQLTEDGTLNAPGGHIVLGLTATSTATAPERSIWFGPRAKVLAGGSTQRLLISADGIATGEVLDGGSIQVVNVSNTGDYSAVNGYVVAESGSLFDVSGVGAGTLQLKSASGITPWQEVASAGGSIEIRAREGLLLAGTLRGAGGGAHASGGSLAVSLESGSTDDERLFSIATNAPAGGIVPSALQPGMPIIVDLMGTGANKGTDLGWFLSGSGSGANARHAGSGWLLNSAFAAGGFGRLKFKSQDVLSFGLGSSDLTLSARDALILDAPILRADNNPALTAGAVFDASGKSLGHALTLSAPYIELGNADLEHQVWTNYRNANDPNNNGSFASSFGNAQLKTAQAATVDLIGNSALQGFGNASLAASADIRLVGLPATDAANKNTGYAPGSLAMTGNLTLTDAQTYPTTLSDFRLSVAAQDTFDSGTLTFASNGNAAEAVLSAGGSMTGIAPHIVQAGRVLAPFGAITFGGLPTFSQPIATSTLEYRAGSVTSVAGEGMVPFGTVANGSIATASDWRYFFGSDPISFQVQPTTGGQLQRPLPAKAIMSYANNITTDSGAVLDLSGGGSLFAYEFTAGKGGSQDILANNVLGSKTTVFAINPNFKGKVAPIDQTYGSDGGLLPGDAVYLSGMPGLPAGMYTLLPAHYALLPGGFSISAAPNTRDLQPSANITQQDGSMLVSGHLAENGSGSAASRSTGFIVQSGTVLRSKSEFTAYDAGTYFKDKAGALGLANPELPVDGGYLAFDVTGTAAGALALNGTIRLGAAAGGRAGYADFYAPQITIVSDRSKSAGNAARLVADDLTALGADSLLIGALRDARSDGMHLAVVDSQRGDTVVKVLQEVAAADLASVVVTRDTSVDKGVTVVTDTSTLNDVIVATATTTITQKAIPAANVTLANDAQHPLGAADIVILASATVKLEPKAVIQSSGTLGRAAQDILLDGDGALLRVSSGGQVALTRGAVTGNSGTLDIGSGASVAATGSAYLDGSRSVLLDGRLNLAPAAALAIGAPGIDLGSGLPAAASGVQFDTAALDAFGGLSELAFNSYASSINLYGTVNLGSSAMRTLSFQGAGFQGAGDAARAANFTAASVRFDGYAAYASPSPAPASVAAGKLSVNATDIAIGSGAFVIRGYADSVFNASSEVLASGIGGQLVAQQNLTLAAARIATARAADASFKAGAKLTLSGIAGAAIPSSAPALGGKLVFSGAAIASDALIEAPSGQVLLSATNGIDITGGRISTAGAGTSFGSTVAYAPGGRIELDAGNVSVAAAAVLDVSAVGAAAGTLSVTARKGDYAKLEGIFKGSAAAGIDGVLPSQGQFVLNANFAYQVDSAGLKVAEGAFGALNAKLNDAGFTESRQFSFKQGDVALGGSDQVIAHDFLLAVNNGNITIDADARIVASGAKGGSIELYASQTAASGNAGRVTLGGNASLQARGLGKPDGAAGSTGNGGRVVIGSASADGLAPALDGGSSIHLDGGSIDVAGSSSGRNGTLTLRAPRIGSPAGSDVALGSVKTRIDNSSASVVEAVKVYAGSSISGAPDDAGINLDAGMHGSMYTDAGKFIDNKAAILNRLQDPALSLSAGIEVRAPGALTVSVNEFAADAAERGWNLGAWRFGGAPVALTLRAQGDLNILGSISDGFVKPAAAALGMPDWQLGSGPSAGYRFAGGANLAAANPLAVVAGTGDVLFGFAGRSPTSPAPLSNTDAPVALVRTGTGRIDVAAGRDVNLALAAFFTSTSADASVNGTPVIFDAHTGNSYKVSLYGASVYTAGQASVVPAGAGFSAPENALNTHYGAAANTLTSAEFGSGGGAISVTAGRDVNGPSQVGGFYRKDGTAAVVADPENQITAANAVPGSKVMLPGTIPQLFNNWLFRQGRSQLDASGNTIFEKLGDGSTLNTAWWSRFDYFDQGIATFGGGDVRVNAGGKIADLSVSVATNAYATGAGPGQLREQGGGDLLLRAGGDILGGAFYVQKGTASLHADGAIAAGNGVLSYQPVDQAGNVTSKPAPLNTILALGDAQFDVTAGHDLTIESAFNPMLTEQSVNNVPLNGAVEFSAVSAPGTGAIGAQWDVADTSEGAKNYRKTYAQFSNFSTYTADSAVHLTALGGNLTLSNDAAKLAAAGNGNLKLFSLSDDAAAEAGTGDIGNRLAAENSVFRQLYLLAPSTLSAVALSGDLTTSNSFTMMPSPRGQLDLLASGSVTLNNTTPGGIRMLDNDPNAMSVSAAPRVFTQPDFNVLTGDNSPGLAAHVLGNLHAGDAQPVRIIALNGDILGVGNSNTLSTLSLPKAAQISAGRDIVDLGLSIQQNAASDVTSLVAGRDIIDATQPGVNRSKLSDTVAGSGRIELSAGRNVDFGNSNGVVTRGNLDNPYLADGGASINVVAGGAPADYVSLVRFYGVSAVSATLTAANLTAPDQRDLIAYVHGAAPALVAESLLASNTAELTPADALRVFGKLADSKQRTFLASHPGLTSIPALLDFVRNRVPGLKADVSLVDAWASFRALPQAQQNAFLDAHQAAPGGMLSGLASADKPAQNAAFFAALVGDSKASGLGAFDGVIASLYPAAAKAGSGNIALFNSQLKTEQGGAIDMFAPTGSVYAGLTLGVIPELASVQGIFTIRGGAIRALVENDFLVNQGRVFTLGGGDITLVSQYGNIDAGKGAKTASSAPPPLITFDTSGAVHVDISGSISGSGIATLKTHPDQPDSNVYAVAPRGIFDAGDAGVRSTGSVDIVAPVVLNGANISAGGSIGGAAVAVAAPSLGSVAAPASAAAKNDDVAKTLGNVDPAAKSASLAVEVLGYGEDADRAPDAGDDKDDAETKKKKTAQKNKQQQPT